MRDTGASATRLCSFALIFLLAACAGVTRAPVAPPPSPQPTPTIQARTTCATKRFEGDSFIVCRYERTHQELRLVSKDASGGYIRTFAALNDALGLNASRIAFAMNAGMFEESGAPVGLYVANGIEQYPLVTNDGAGNFYMKPNGVFFVDVQGAPHVETTEHYAVRSEKPQWATQSGPMLLIDGKLNPHFQNDGPSHYVRNGVGVGGGGEATFAISQAPVSFGKFARMFRDALNCTNALYFDGNVSSLWTPLLGRQDHGRALGPMVVVLEQSFPFTQ